MNRSTLLLSALMILLVGVVLLAPGLPTDGEGMVPADQRFPAARAQAFVGATHAAPEGAAPEGAAPEGAAPKGAAPLQGPGGIYQNGARPAATPGPGSPRSWLAVVFKQVDTEELVLRDTYLGFPYCMEFDVHRSGSTYWLNCAPAVGHNLSIRLERFSSPDEAQAAFDAARGEQPTECFYGYWAASWEYSGTPAQLPMRHRIFTWYAQRWFVYADAFDDTEYTIAPNPRVASEDLLTHAAGYPLFPAQGGVCTFGYRPGPGIGAEAMRSR